MAASCPTIRHRGAPTGFVLVELLFVITMICILAAILFPVYALSRRKGFAVSCLNNLQQIGMALHFYAEDHDGRFPPTDDDFAPLYPRYIAEEQVFICPSPGGWSPPPPTPNLPGGSAEAGVPPPMTVTTSYLYLSGKTLDDRGDALLAADGSPFTHNGRANALFVSGKTRSIAPSEWVDQDLPSPPTAMPPPGGLGR